MNKVKKPASLICIVTLLITVMYIFTRSKHYDYTEVNSVEYNKHYNEKYPIIDTLEPYYINANRIFIRKGFNIGGHEGIGSLNGGSQMLFICNPDCVKCQKK